MSDLDEARRERDLAIAHDTQPYPTADAYERVCAARDKWQARTELANERLAVLAEAVRMYLEAAAKPAYSWVDEGQRERDGHVNREKARMAHVAAARASLIALLDTLSASRAAGLDVERLADIAVMALGEVTTGAAYGLYHKSFREHFVARLARADEYRALATATPATPDVDALAKALQEADWGMRDPMGRKRSRVGYYWRDLATLALTAALTAEPETPE